MKTPVQFTLNGEELTEGVMTLLPGDRANLETPGGGGFGNPAERDVAAVFEDVRQGYVSAVETGRSYGETLEPSPAPVGAGTVTSDRKDDSS